MCFDAEAATPATERERLPPVRLNAVRGRSRASLLNPPLPTLLKTPSNLNPLVPACPHPCYPGPNCTVRNPEMNQQTPSSSLSRFFSAPLTDSDPELSAAISKELARQQDGIELIASENIVSAAVLEAQG